MNSRALFFTLLLLLLSGGLLGAQALTPAQRGAPRPSTPPPCAHQPEFHQFDFWIGRWAIYSAKHVKSAEVTVAPVLGGCALAETWTSLADPSSDGRGYGTYDPAIRRWLYFWVSGGAYTSFWTGGREGRAMNFDFALPSPGAMRRWSMKPLSDGRIEEQSTTSTDGGKTWKTQYTLYWIPAK